MHNYFLNGLSIASTNELDLHLCNEEPIFYLSHDTEMLPPVAPDKYECNCDGIGFWVSPGRYIRLKSDKITSCGVDRHWEPFELAILGAAMRLIRGEISFHASAIAEGENATLFLGDSGAGKSTNAAKHAVLGSEILADDVCSLVCKNDNILTYYNNSSILLSAESRGLIGMVDALAPVAKTKIIFASKPTFLPLIVSKLVVLSDSVAWRQTLTELDALRLILRHVWFPKLTIDYLGHRHLDLLSQIVATCPVEVQPNWRQIKSAACGERYE